MEGVCTSPVIIRHLCHARVYISRAISDREVEAIARHCPQLEQFDILGSGSVTKYSIEK